MKKLLMGLVAAVALAGVVTLPAQAQKKDKEDKQTRSVQGVVSDNKDTAAGRRRRAAERHEDSSDPVLHHEAEWHVSFP